MPQQISQFVFTFYKWQAAGRVWAGANEAEHCDIMPAAPCKNPVKSTDNAFPCWQSLSLWTDLAVDCPALRYKEVPAVKRVDIGQCDHVIMDTILEGRGDAQCDPVNHLTRENSRTRAVAVKLTKELVTPPRHGLLRNNFIALSWCMKLYFLNFWFQYFVASLPGE